MMIITDETNISTNMTTETLTTTSYNSVFNRTEYPGTKQTENSLIC